jgi:hypothetical protein
MGVGFTAGLLVLAGVGLVTSSRWWHERYHHDGHGLRVFSCDHCLKLARFDGSDDRWISHE